MEHSELADTILLKKADNFRLASTEEEICSIVFFPKYHVTQTFKQFQNKIRLLWIYKKFNILCSTYYM